MRYFILIIVLGIAACHSSDNGKDKTDATLNDSIGIRNNGDNIKINWKELKKVYSLFYESIHYDKTLNPYIMQHDTFGIYTCDSLKNSRDIFNCIVNQFISIKLPAMFYEYEFPRYFNNMYDSTFIANILLDTFASHLDFKDIVRYSKGKIIDKTSNYIWITFIKSGCEEYDYILSTFTLDGKLVDTKTLPNDGGAIYESNHLGIIHDKKHFEIDYISIIQDPKTHRLTNSHEEHQHYIVNDRGKFLAVSTDSINREINL